MPERTVEFDDRRNAAYRPRLIALPSEARRRLFDEERQHRYWDDKWFELHRSMWKTAEALLDSHDLQVVHFRSGTGQVIMEINWQDVTDSGLTRGENYQRVSHGEKNAKEYYGDTALDPEHIAEIVHHLDTVGWTVQITEPAPNHHATTLAYNCGEGWILAYTRLIIADGYSEELDKVSARLKFARAFLPPPPPNGG